MCFFCLAFFFFFYFSRMWYFTFGIKPTQKSIVAGTLSGRKGSMLIMVLDRFQPNLKRKALRCAIIDNIMFLSHSDVLQHEINTTCVVLTPLLMHQCVLMITL